MKIHEYQAKKIFKDYGINVPDSVVCEKKEEISDKIANFKIPCVIKAQVHSGARGKAGGVKVAKTKKDAVQLANNILGMELKSSQAGSKTVHKILIEEAVDIDKELYLSLTFDRQNECIALILSKEGGMDIEKVAKVNSQAILTKLINAGEDFELETIVKKMGFDEQISSQIEDVIKKLYKLCIEKDATLVEINPLVVTKQRNVIAIDAKMIFDDNALFRHP
jgi:succinyl-CoA synthetase beta subunit